MLQIIDKLTPELLHEFKTTQVPIRYIGACNTPKPQLPAGCLMHGRNIRVGNVHVHYFNMKAVPRSSFSSSRFPHLSDTYLQKTVQRMNLTEMVKGKPKLQQWLNNILTTPINKVPRSPERVELMKNAYYSMRNLYLAALIDPYMQTIIHLPLEQKQGLAAQLKYYAL